MPNPNEYIVALRYTATAGGYEGVVYWTTFESETELDDYLRNVTDQEVVERGITQARAIELAMATPMRSRLLAALDESTNKETGVVSTLMLRMRLDEIFDVTAMQES